MGFSIVQILPFCFFSVQETSTAALAPLATLLSSDEPLVNVSAAVKLWRKLANDSFCLFSQLGRLVLMVWSPVLLLTQSF